MNYKTYHYGDDQIDDSGWGCSYRNIQTILSCYQKNYNPKIIIPNITTILNFFSKNINSENKIDLWIEPYQISIYLENYYDELYFKHCLYVINDTDTSKILKTDFMVYIDSIFSFDEIYVLIQEHFKVSKLPIVIDNGTYSYCMVLKANSEIFLIDPHVKSDNNVFIKSLDFLKKSFWMILFPKLYQV